MTPHTTDVVNIARFDILVRWRAVLFPFEQSSLIQILPEQGYVVPQAYTEPPPIGGRLETTGPIATKGALRLIVNAAGPGIQLYGTDAIDTVTEFERLEEVLRDQLGFDSRAQARFYEVDAQVTVTSHRSPITTLRGRTDLGKLAENVGVLLGHRVAPFGVRFVTPDSLPTSEDWQELLIEPSLRSPEHSYYGILVFRRKQWEPVKDVALRINEIFEKLPAELERL